MNCITKSQLLALSGLAFAAAILGITATAKLFLPLLDTAAVRMEAAPAPAKRFFCPEGGNSQYSILHGGFVCGTE